MGAVALRERVPMVRVSRSRPCPVCGKPKGCGVAEYDRVLVVHCVRIGQGAVRQTATGWVHHLPREEGALPRWQPVRPPAERAPLAPLARRIAVYEAMLEILRLSGRHREHLVTVRGLHDAAIAAHGFRSLPAGIERQRLVRRLRDRFGPEGVKGVPGFWRPDTAGGWQLAGLSGLVIPIRTVRGRVYALQVRPDHPGESGAKYCLVSSGHRPNGASSGTPYHMAWPGGRPQAQAADVILTEGPLKAIVIAERTGLPVMAATSAYTWRPCLEPLRRLGPRRVLLAWDNDWRTNPAVARQLAALARALEAMGLQPARLAWDEAYKGLDDYLLAGARTVH
ncbi:hypothetical protein [Thermaerobacter litoralis]